MKRLILMKLRFDNNKNYHKNIKIQNTSPSDKSLLKKLSNIMCQTGLSQKEQSLNDIDLDY